MRKTIISSLLVLAVLGLSGAFLAGNAQAHNISKGMKEMRKEMKKEIKKTAIGGKTIVGIVVSITGDTLKVKSGKKEFTAKVDSNDILANRVWDKIVLADIKENDKVMIFGLVQGLNIEAKMVRNLSLPQVAANPAETEEDDD